MLIENLDYFYITEFTRSQSEKVLCACNQNINCFSDIYAVEYHRAQLQMLYEERYAYCWCWERKWKYLETSGAQEECLSDIIGKGSWFGALLYLDTDSSVACPWSCPKLSALWKQKLFLSIFMAGLYMRTEM